jgi:hypothetical protein
MPIVQMEPVLRRESFHSRLSNQHVYNPSGFFRVRKYAIDISIDITNHSLSQINRQIKNTVFHYEIMETSNLNNQHDINCGHHYRHDTKEIIILNRLRNT